MEIYLFLFGRNSFLFYDRRLQKSCKMSPIFEGIYRYFNFFVIMLIKFSYSWYRRLYKDIPSKNQKWHPFHFCFVFVFYNLTKLLNQVTNKLNVLFAFYFLNWTDRIWERMWNDFTLTLFIMGGIFGSFFINFPPATSKNVGISSQNLLTFSSSPFSTLV